MHATDPLHQHFRLKKAQRDALLKLRIETIGDLLMHFPTRYTNKSTAVPAHMATHGQQVVLFGAFGAVTTKKSFRTKIPMATARFTDIHGNTVSCAWFHQPYMAKRITGGEPYQIQGQFSITKDGGFSMQNPEIVSLPTLPIDTTHSLFADGSIEQFGIPIYPESKGITSRWIYHAVQKALGNKAHETLADPIPAEIRQQYNLAPVQSALVWMHTPKHQQDATKAHKRFSFEEIFILHAYKKREKMLYQSLDGKPIVPSPDAVASFVARFPFSLTPSQKRALKTITQDLARPFAMTRLLEGDVGSGKTAVAASVAYAVLSTRDVQNPVQIGYMAPTEVLARQLFENFIHYFDHTNTRVALVTGKTCRIYPSKTNPTDWTDISKSQMRTWIKDGTVPIVVGTHALISKTMVFRDLRLVIVDEQHRFGTKQRMKLAKKCEIAPHYLSMSATPIPRTLALTIYGDLDISILEHMPKGRKPPKTNIVPDTPDAREKMYTALRAELDQGRQAYIICPRISEPDPQQEKALIAKSVIAEAKRLQKNELAKYKIGIMHSKMKPKEKEHAMAQFADGDIDVLVSTSVVEVGVNVPNATSIIIEGAERFGLAQLHQLRGRVLRSTHQAYCYLLTRTKTQKSIDRLRQFTTAKNGFELAELDLAARGGGDLLGRKQWGVSDRAMEALRNPRLVEAARESATAILEQDIHLKQYPNLLERIDELAEHMHEE